jgi:puromycin-sensitive aminopeptidase
MVSLALGEPLLAGQATLELAYAGTFSPGLRGLYASAEVAVTQFEAADARRVFPCFDEPAFKAPWQVTLTAPAGACVLGNGVTMAEVANDGRVRVELAETPPLPSYLIALVSGRIEAAPAVTVAGVPVRTFAVPEKRGLTGFGQAVAEAVLPRLEAYFGLPYAFGKLDQVAVPDFEAGAMENAGLITYRETALLCDPQSASIAQRKRIAEVVTHEIAHQWFGNWVTMAWWDDLWLNEAFATWMAYKIVNEWQPGWRMWLDFDVGKAAALRLDELSSTHPIRAEVPNAEAAGESFDLITYEKGGAVLRMIEGYLGAERFRDGIRIYMQRHARGNATAGDLWRALGEASREPVEELADAWIGQSGHPVIDVALAGGAVRLRQSRLFSQPGVTSADRWPVPLVLRYEDDAGAHARPVLLREPMAEVALDPRGEIRWLCANGGATGFYRCQYDDDAAGRLQKQLYRLEPAERVALIGDEWALVRAGRQDIQALCELLASLGGERDHFVLEAALARFGFLERRLVEDVARPRLRALIERLFLRRLRELGWDGAPDESDRTRLERLALIGLCGVVARSQPVLAEARTRLHRFLGGDAQAIEPNLHEAAVLLSARGGDAADFDRFRERFQTEAEPARKRRYLFALAAFESADLATRAEELAFSSFVPLQDLAGFVSVLLGNPSAREGAFARLRAEFSALLARTEGAPAVLRRIIEALGQLPQRRHLTEVQALFSRHPVPAAKQTIAQTLEHMEQDLSLCERAQPSVQSWLAEREPLR